MHDEQNVIQFTYFERVINRSVCSLKEVVHIRKCCVASFIAEGEKINAYVSYHVATGSIQSKVFALNVTVYKTIAFDWADNSIQKKEKCRTLSRRLVSAFDHFSLFWTL